ncbi:GAF and ANTAR domain-containing protein [Actinopolymorpha pittospori]|uniref:ANTAR domain-containing protein n=1 Tax=Actinopolymorpha pittospori TaxID=648752 RepID=A0A927RGJ3_9ACTN|nr:GAF and ANTAR domain-containing protein [Actinopolymorpha pittospori]MBE1604276.1 hypothetical protein [Actinopolymorpha pittospori]
MPDDISNELFASLQCLVIALPSLRPYLDRLAWAAGTIVDPPAWCGITSTHGGWPVTLSVSDDRARLADQEQYNLGQGPCLDAMRDGKVVEVVDQEMDGRWTQFHGTALGLGIRSMLSLPISGVSRRPLITLNLYSERPRAFTGVERQQAESYANFASRTLVKWVRDCTQDRLAREVEQAIRTRTLVEESLGILMVQHQWDAPMAFRRLRTRAGNDARYLGVTASEVIAEATGRQPIEPYPFGLCPRQ